jgi:hypothetical protein
MLRKFILGPGWQRMLGKKLPEIIARIDSHDFVAGPVAGKVSRC